MNRSHVAAILGALALGGALELAPSAAQDKSKPAAATGCSCGETSREQWLERRALEVTRALATKLPGNPFTDVKVGDYWLYSVRTLQGDGPVARGHLVWRVAEEEGDDVRVTEEASGEAVSWLGKSRWFNRQDPPTLANLMPLAGARGRLVNVADVAFVDDRHNTNGEVFISRRLTWTALYLQAATEPQGFTGTLWHATDARSSVIGLQLKQLGMDDRKTAIELVGYGTDGKASWGKSLDAVK